MRAAIRCRAARTAVRASVDRGDTRAFGFGDGRDQAIVVLAAQGALDRRGCVTRYQEMYGRGVGCRLGHGARRFPELQQPRPCRARRWRRQAPAPPSRRRSRSERVVVCEASGERSSRSMRWNPGEASSQLPSVPSDSTPCSCCAGGISRGARPRRPRPERDLTLVAAVRGNPISLQPLRNLGEWGCLIWREADRAANDFQQRDERLVFLLMQGVESGEECGARWASQIIPGPEEGRAGLIGSIAPALPQTGMPSQDAQ